MRKLLLLAALAATLSGLAEARKVMNVVNFVRALDPRGSHADYVNVVKEEVALNRRYGFRNTVLLQYDALVDAEMLAAAKGSDPEKTEFGLWFEMSQPLNEAAGLPWRPTGQHAGWKWDWFINPGFLMAYDHAGRKALIDAAFARFKAEFGDWPKSVGSWLLDAWSMDYMVETYGVDGFCICREQDNTDAYGLRGGYSNGAYYPSKRNMLSAAVDMANAVRAPVFKMLTPDPFYNYLTNPRTKFPEYPFARGCPTMEPVWACGQRRDIVDWFFRVYVDAPGLLNLSYMQTGQENSFGLKSIMAGLPYQCEKIAQARDAGRLVVETMGETARRFKRDHAANVPQTQVALENWTGPDRRTVWYNSRFYRANLLFDQGHLYFRDIHKMCDAFEEPFLDTVCTGWKAEYFTPPVVDQVLFEEKGRTGVLELDGRFTGISVATPAADELEVVATRADGRTARIRFREGSVSVAGASLKAEYAAAALKSIGLADGRLRFDFRGFRYEVGVRARAARTQAGFAFQPVEGVLSFDLAL